MAQAQRSRMSPEQYAQQLQQGGNIAEFVADVRRTKTLAQLLEQTTITDASGNVVDLEALRPKTIQAPAADDEATTPSAEAADRGRPRTTRDGLSRPHRYSTTPSLPHRGGAASSRFGAGVALRRRRTPPRQGLSPSEVRVRVDRTQAIAGGQPPPGGAVPGPHHQPSAHRDRLHRQSYGGHRTREHYPPEPRRARRMMRGAGGMMNLGDSVYERLLRERIIFLGSQVDDVIANQLAAQMLLLSAEDPKRDIHLYINSPGGSVTAGMAIYDTMQFIDCDVATYGMGLAASMGQFLLTAGTAGKRYALPHARIMMHQPSAGVGGTASDIAIQADLFRRTKSELNELQALHTGPAGRADREGLRPRPLVHRAGGPRVRLRRPRGEQGRHDRQQQPGHGQLTVRRN